MEKINAQVVETLVTRTKVEHEQFIVIRDSLTQEKFIRFFADGINQDVPLVEFKAALEEAEKEENVVFV